ARSEKHANFQPADRRVTDTTIIIIDLIVQDKKQGKDASFVLHAPFSFEPNSRLMQPHADCSPSPVLSAMPTPTPTVTWWCPWPQFLRFTSPVCPITFVLSGRANDSQAALF
ncbi:hypothetical protein CIHG_01333, partial [Coccidioides immitis H538.4]